MMGRRGRKSGSNIFHIASPSEIWVSASIIPFIIHLRNGFICKLISIPVTQILWHSSKQVMFDGEIEKRSIIVGLPVKTDGHPDAAHDLQIFFVDNRCADSRG